MRDIQIPITRNGTTTFLTAGKYCPSDIHVEVAVPSEQIPAYERFATIDDALTGANPGTTGNYGGYTDEDHLRHIVLLTDISSSAVLTLSADCVLHLNGRVLTFTAADTHLNVVAAGKVTIDGSVSGSKITKSVAGGNQRLVSATDTHLTINGGTYSLSVTDGTFCIPIRTESAATKLDMDGCTVLSEGVGNTFAKCAQVYGTINIGNCDFTASSHSNSAIGIHAVVGSTLMIQKSNVDAYTSSGAYVRGVEGSAEGLVGLTDCDISVKAPMQGTVVYGVYTSNSQPSTLHITNCRIEADGCADVGSDVYGVCAVDVSPLCTAVITGGHYKAAREALSIFGTACIDGGVYEGCQHGGGYLCGKVKVKNAAFRNIPYYGNYDWNGNYYGACYCGASTGNADVIFDNCRFEVEDGHSVGYIFTAKYTGTTVYMSNSAITGNTTYTTMRADPGNIIYVGENVSYDTARSTKATIDTTTYANQSFAW